MDMGDRFFAINQCLMSLEGTLNPYSSISKQNLSFHITTRVNASTMLNPGFQEKLYFHSPFVNDNNERFCKLVNVRESPLEIEKLESIIASKSLLELEKIKTDIPVAKKAKLQLKHEKKTSAGDKWYNLGEKQKMTEVSKMDLDFIQMRTLADPKLFMKQADEKPEHVEIGTLVSSAKDYYSEKRQKGHMKDKHFADMLIENQKFKTFARRQRAENERTNGWRKNKKRKTS